MRLLSLLIVYTVCFVIGDVNVFIAIDSKPGSTLQRDAQRTTFLSNLDSRVQYTFFVETNLDVSRTDVQFLTSKDPTDKLFEIISFVNKHAPTSFLLKIDDATFVHLPRLLSALDTAPTDLLWRGNIVINPVKDPKSYENDETMLNKDFWKNCTYYPNLPGKGGYLLSRDLVDWINSSTDLLKKYTTENLSLAAWMLAVNAKPVVDPKFHDSLSCDNDFITFGSLSVEDMKNVYNNKIC